MGAAETSRKFPIEVLKVKPRQESHAMNVGFPAKLAEFKI